MREEPLSQTVGAVCVCVCVCARAQTCLCLSGAAQFCRASRVVREGWLGWSGAQLLKREVEEAQDGVLWSHLGSRVLLLSLPVSLCPICEVWVLVVTKGARWWECQASA